MILINTSSYSIIFNFEYFHKDSYGRIFGMVLFYILSAEFDPHSPLENFGIDIQVMHRDSPYNQQSSVLENLDC